MFIEGLMRIVKEEIGNPGDEFTSIATNDMESDSSPSIGVLLARKLHVPLLPIKDAHKLPGDGFSQEYEDAANHTRQMGLQK